MRTAKQKTALLLIFPILIVAILLLNNRHEFVPTKYASTELGWNLILVNYNNQIPEDYSIELTLLSNGQKVDSRIYPALQQMFDDMRRQDIYPTVTSGYRTVEYQQQLLDEKIDELTNQGYSLFAAKKEAQKWVAMVGHSEHQIGLAVDINAVNGSSNNDVVYAWLAENSWKYGFILRYPKEKTEITQISYEPWHYRYVGIEASTEIYEKGYCLEEYIELISK